MDASIILKVCLAWLSAAPASSLNQPQPRAARPVPPAVMPAAHQDAAESDSEAALIPPEPLPEFFLVGDAQYFDVTQPESCQDSHVCPPAPPAELDVAAGDDDFIDLDGRKYRCRVFNLQILQTGTCDEEIAECPDPIPFQILPESSGITLHGRRMPAQLFSSEVPPVVQPEDVLRLELVPARSSGGIEVQALGNAGTAPKECWRPAETCDAAGMSKDQLRHLEAAIEHLAAAGLTDVAERLRNQQETAAKKLRAQQRRELEAKEAELQRLTEEVERLKADLMSDSGARVELELQHFIVRLEALRKLEKEATGELWQAAHLVLTVLDPAAYASHAYPWSPESVSRKDSSGDKARACPDAIRLLQKEGVVILRNARKLETHLGAETVTKGGFEDESQSNLNQDGTTRRSDLFLVVKPKALPDGRIQSELRYEHVIRDVGTWKSFERITQDGRSEIAIAATPGSPTFGRLTVSSTHDFTPSEWKIVLASPCLPHPGAPSGTLADLALARVDVVGAAHSVSNCERPARTLKTADNSPAWQPQPFAPRSPTIVGIQPLSNSEAAPEQPRQLINPKFYVGGAPPHVEQAWQKAFGPGAGTVVIAPAAPQLPNLERPNYQILQMSPSDGIFSSIIAPQTNTGDDAILLDAPAHSTFLFRLIPSPPAVVRPQTPASSEPQYSLPPAPIPSEDPET